MKNVPVSICAPMRNARSWPRVQRVAEAVLANLGQGTFHEAVIQRGVHVDTLDAAAALAGVVERAVDEVGDGVVEVRIGRHVGRVLPTELQPDVDEALRAFAV